MPSFQLDGPWWVWALWQSAAFLFSFIPNSFIEWLSHRFVLHSKAIVKFAYEEHDRRHHVEYGPDDTFAVHGKDYGLDFHFRDWFLFLVITLPMWTAIEIWSGKPILLGTTLSTLLWLQMFNVIHYHFHAPNGSWIERTWYYRFLMAHHREHHRDPRTNLNVCFFPVADWVLRTRRRPAA